MMLWFIEIVVVLEVYQQDKGRVGCLLSSKGKMCSFCTGAYVSRIDVVSNVCRPTWDFGLK